MFFHQLNDLPLWSKSFEYIKESLVYATAWLNQNLFELENITITPISLIRFILIIFLAFWLSHVLARFLTSYASRQKIMQRSLIYRITRLIQYIIIGIGVIIALSSLGFDLSNFILLASALGVGIGFGLQTIFNNFISGILLLFESQLKVGDFIELESGARGEIREIHFRSTLLKTNEGTDIIVPNSQMINTRVVNWTLSDPYRRVHIPFSAPSTIDKNEMANALIEAAKKLPSTLHKGKPEPIVNLTRLTDKGIECELVVWVTEKANIHNRYTVSDYLWIIDDTLRQLNIDKPRLEKSQTRSDTPN